MKNYIFKKYLVASLVLAFVFSFFPGIASAASIYFETTRTNVSVGDTFIVSAKIDAKGTSINSVEGDVVLESNNENLVVNDFSLAKSIFSLWPRTPSLSKDGNTISFVGGVPGGFNLDKAILFNIVVEADKEGSVKISPKNMAIYANDGKGTRVPVDFTSLDIKISPKSEINASVNEWNSLVASDKINPEKFAIIIGKDNSLFEGKRFAFFTAVDNQSGISYYEVSENGKPAIRSGSMYVLENQDLNSTPNLVVTAYDKAGNKTISTYSSPGITFFGFSLKFIVIIVIILLIWILVRRIRKNKKNAENIQ
jgi:hypothetical protein